MNNSQQQQQAQQFAQQQASQANQKQPAPTANDEIARIAQLGYN